MTDLLPCPFCKSERVQSCLGIGATYLVECQSCETSGPRAMDQSAAIAAWNKRTFVPAQASADTCPWEVPFCSKCGSAGGCEKVRAQQAVGCGKSWSPDQFWDYVEGLTDPLVCDQLRETLAERGLSLTCAFGAVQSPRLRKADADGGFNIIIDNTWAAFFPKASEAQIDFLIDRVSASLGHRCDDGSKAFPVSPETSVPASPPGGSGAENPTTSSVSSTQNHRRSDETGDEYELRVGRVSFTSPARGHAT